MLYLLILVAAFLGLDLDLTDTLPDDVAEHCEPRWPTDWDANPYVWERCLVGDAYYTDLVTDTEAAELAAAAWADYVPDDVEAPSFYVGRWAAGLVCGADADGCYHHHFHAVAVAVPERYLVLHEVAHAIHDHQDPQPFRFERDSHPLAFRCIALDLFIRYGDIAPGPASVLTDVCERAGA